MLSVKLGAECFAINVDDLGILRVDERVVFSEEMEAGLCKIKVQGRPLAFLGLCISCAFWIFLNCARAHFSFGIEIRNAGDRCSVEVPRSPSIMSLHQPIAPSHP